MVFLSQQQLYNKFLLICKSYWWLPYATNNLWLWQATLKWKLKRCHTIQQYPALCRCLEEYTRSVNIIALLFNNVLCCSSAFQRKYMLLKKNRWLPRGWYYTSCSVRWVGKKGTGEENIWLVREKWQMYYPVCIIGEALASSLYS